MKLTYSKQFIPYNVDITTDDYKTFIYNYQQKEEIGPTHIFKTYDDLNLYQSYVYPYKFITDIFVLLQDIKLEEKQKKIRMKDLLCINCVKSIVKYRPLSFGFFDVIEILHKFNILTDHNVNILEISGNPIYIEACDYYKKKYFGNRVKWNYNLIFTNRYTYLKSFSSNEFIKYYSQFKKVNTMIYDDWIKIDFISNHSKKYNIIFSNITNPAENINWDEYLLTQYNTQLFFLIFCYVMTHLIIGGTFILYVGNIETKAIADLIVFGKSLFKQIDIYMPKIYNKGKYAGTSVIFSGFLGIEKKKLNDIMKIASELIKNDPTSQKMKLTKKNIEEYRLPKNGNKLLINSNQHKFISSFLDMDAKDSQYDFIRMYNKNKYWEQIQFINRVIDLKQSSTDQKTEKIAKYRNEQIISSILWTKEFDMELMTFVDKEVFEDEMGKLILRDMFSYHFPIDFKFRKSSNKEANLIDIPNDFWRLSNKFNMAQFMIDTRDITLWDTIKERVRYYKQKKGTMLTDYISDNYDTGKISQAWLKMYEMIELYDLLPKSELQEFKTFSFCEAPGNFIRAMEYYAKTKTKIKNIDWNAQSLNPKNPKNIKKYGNSIFGKFDEYKLMKKYANRWKYGKDGTGDILNYDNIRSYKQFCKDVSLITSDCGLGWRENSPLFEIDIAQIIAILYCLPKGGNCVAKFVLPINSILMVSMLYIMYESFNTFIFYKSIQNQYSGEFYIIGKNYTPSKMINQLMNMKIDENTNLFPKGFPEEFVHQLVAATEKIVNNFVFHIDRQLYYVDNVDLIPKEHFDLVKKYLYKKNIDWIKQFKFK